ncbi:MULTISPECIES: ATP-binding cassette domain-containing protein [unclassified Paenibacillus]|uniref:ATP-binding cassette domain-containing protein n=1 Tax=unclassified Paenibacillus TaxID=185978 RepID=UPI000954EDB4|nr:MULTISPECIES: ATP-binding cassette domain-containing protein [unclassified Paenibacillus]ASS68911.1 ATP-binding cassette domain-containing protein [Paenibacillus sp. RUD330]SIR15110.1 ABC-type multidrug transport system, ATPase component [Paenibacillus sp. RU4X]SIR22817.1 ABC-type multidrug transport system, ATPase component [Paenibacillus sp. RU4T]
MIELSGIRWQRRSFVLQVPRLVLKEGITVLSGSNGSGKSSLLQLLATAEFPDRGSIRYGTMTPDRDLASIRASIGYVPTGLELYEDMKTERLLKYLSELKGEAGMAETDKVIAQFQLEPYRRRAIKTLPQGIRQRIALAQSVIGSPNYLFLDEPLNALDSLERLRFIRFLALYARKRTVVVSSHELNEWEAWATRVLWLHEGKPGFLGSAREWTGGLPLSVWQGTVDASRYASLPAESMLQVRPEGNFRRVRIMSAESPGPEFEPMEPTLEDAYFIRSRR